MELTLEHAKRIAAALKADPRVKEARMKCDAALIVKLEHPRSVEARLAYQNAGKVYETLVNEIKEGVL